MKLYPIPVSNDSQEVLVALYEKGIEFESVLAPIWDPGFLADRTLFQRVFAEAEARRAARG